MKLKITKSGVFLLCILVPIVLLPNSSYSQSLDSGHWKTFETKILSFAGPEDLVSRPFKGIDSEVWKFGRPDMEIVIDLGLYSGKPQLARSYKTFSEKAVLIDNREATIVRFEFNDPKSRDLRFGAIVSFKGIGSDHENLTFAVFCKTPREQEVAEEIFHSIKFEEKVGVRPAMYLSKIECEN